MIRISCSYIGKAHPKACLVFSGDAGLMPFVIDPAEPEEGKQKVIEALKVVKAIGHEVHTSRTVQKLFKDVNIPKELYT